MKNLKLGLKIGIGFGILIVISLLLGGLAVVSMKGVANQSAKLAEAYVPEVAVSNEVERSSYATTVYLRSFAFTENQAFLESGLKEMENLKKYLKDAETLAAQQTFLVKLKEAVPKVQSLVAEWERLTGVSADRVKAMHDARTRMDQSAAAFMDNIEKFLSDQEQTLAEEVRSKTEQAKVLERIGKVHDANKVMDLGNSLRVANFRAQALRDPKLALDAMPRFDELVRIVDSITRVTRTEANLKQLAAIKQSALDYKAAMSTFLANWEELQAVGKKRMELADQVVTAAQENAKAGMDHTRTIANDAQSNLASASYIMLVGLVCAIVLGVIVAVSITRLITIPVLKGVEFAKSMAQGDLTQTIDVDQKDEIGVLAKALSDMAARLREVMTDVMSAANNVASGSEELSASAESMSQGATEQAASIEEVSSSMEEMTSNIKQTSDNAMQTDTIALKAAKDAQEGGKAVIKTVTAMREIAEKISIIEEIARQTNLLALNAAIEAARAGEHGKGFAVVAAEVRKLAERSGAAAAEISQLSSSSVEISVQAGDMLNKIVPDIQKTAELVQEIAAASAEQNTGAEQINKAIQQLDQVIQQNASASEEVASTAEELSGQSEQLLQAISFFRLDGVGSIRKPVAALAVRTAVRKPGGVKKIARRPVALGGGVDIDMKQDDAGDDFERY